MNPTSEQLNQLLQFLNDSLQSTVDFASQQIPILFQELISWLFWSNLISAILCMFFGLLSLVLSILILRNKSFKWGLSNAYEFIGWKFLSVPTILMTCILIPVSLEYTIDTVKVAVAPRIACLEWVGDRLN